MITIALIAAAAISKLPSASERLIHQRLALRSYRSATADLNGDGKPEILVYATDPEMCGTGGCNLYVLSRRRDAYRIVMRSTLVQLPIRLLPTKSHGWRDIGVTVSGGGIRRSYTAAMRFNGKRYPNNPTVPPAAPVPPSGKVIISR